MDDNILPSSIWPSELVNEGEKRRTVKQNMSGYQIP